VATLGPMWRSSKISFAIVIVSHRGARFCCCFELLFALFFLFLFLRPKRSHNVRNGKNYRCFFGARLFVVYFKIVKNNVVVYLNVCVIKMKL